MKAFDVDVNGKHMDYRVGAALDLSAVRRFLEKTYHVEKLWQGGRHVLGVLEKDGKELFFKLATTEGISFLTKIEYEWNDEFNKLNPRRSSNFWVPQNVDSGVYQGNLFYFITDKFNGRLLADRPQKSETAAIREHLPAVIEFSELIQALPITVTREQNLSAQEFFHAKTQSWYDAIPEEVRSQNGVDRLWSIVDRNYKSLEERPRHGDFTPWHIFALDNGKLGLIDGEHGVGNGVAYYDIAYFIQRVWCVLENPELARDIIRTLIERKYDPQTLRTVLAARGIGGYLDESLREKPDYTLTNAFSDFVQALP